MESAKEIIQMEDQGPQENSTNCNLGISTEVMSILVFQSYILI